MTTMTLAVPAELKRKMEQHSEINWSEVARKAFRQKIADLEFLESFKRESSLTEEDAIRYGTELNRKLAVRYVAEGDK